MFFPSKMKELFPPGISPQMSTKFFSEFFHQFAWQRFSEKRSQHVQCFYSKYKENDSLFLNSVNGNNSKVLIVRRIWEKSEKPQKLTILKPQN
jgi:hypothetical protein